MVILVKNGIFPGVAVISIAKASDCLLVQWPERFCLNVVVYLRTTMTKKMVTCPSTLLTSLTLKPRIRAGNLLPCLPHQSYTIQVGPGALPCFMALTVVLFCSCIVGILIFLMFVFFLTQHFAYTFCKQFLESLNTQQYGPDTVDNVSTLFVM